MLINRQTADLRKTIMQEPDQSQEMAKTHALEKPPTYGWVLFIATTAMIIAIISLVFQYFFWELHQKTENQLIQKARQLEGSFQPQFQTIQSELRNQQRLLNEFTVQIQSDERRKSLRLGEQALHILTLANYSLLFENNTDLVAALVADAGQKLQEAKDPSLLSVRQALIGFLTNLQSTPKVDFGALLSRISAISDQVSSLSTLPVLPAKPVAKQKPTTALSWKEKLMDTFRSLKGIVTIRRLSEPLKPLASPEEQIYIVENIRLQLTKAEWGLLHQNPVVYQNGLEQAKKQLQKYYFRNPAGANLIKSIEELQQINIKPKLPDLTNILSTLQLQLNNIQQALNTSTKSTSTPTPQMPAAPTTQLPRALPS